MGDPLSPRGPRSPSSVSSHSSKLAQSDGAVLPPRVIVENPDDSVFLGEDPTRLGHELAEAQRAQDGEDVRAAQPGTQRFVELRQLMYLTQLQLVVLSRKRKAAILIGVDLLCMAMFVLVIIYNRPHPARPSEERPLYLKHRDLVLHSTGATLDSLALTFVLRENVPGMMVAVGCHTIHFVGCLVADNPLVVILRVFVILFCFQLASVVAEKQWVRSGETERPSVRLGNCSCLLRHHFLNYTLTSLRTQYESALAAQREEARSAAATQTAPVVVAPAPPAARPVPASLSSDEDTERAHSNGGPSRSPATNTPQAESPAGLAAEAVNGAHREHSGSRGQATPSEGGAAGLRTMRRPFLSLPFRWGRRS